MHDYKPYVVPESLNKRHPYIQEPFTGDIDPKQVFFYIFTLLDYACYKRTCYSKISCCLK